MLQFGKHPLRMSKFHGKQKRRSYFEGWYMKQQCGADTIAFIPAFHISDKGQPSASLQIITDTEAFHIDFKAQELWANKKKLFIQLADCIFSEQGCRLNISTPDLHITGILNYGPLLPPAYDIMGPFRFLPFMECRHSIFSLSHRVDGEVTINGKTAVFQNASGYIEGDRGVSFPKRYIWTQCNWNNNCIMLSVADLYFCGRNFNGCIGAVYFNKKEYRIATYLGVKFEYISNKSVALHQGELTLTIELLKSSDQILRAPISGNMTRSIHESAACRVRYVCTLKNSTLFDIVNDYASYEGNWE